jgi:hypothetical protein
MLFNVTQKILLRKLQSENLEMSHRVKEDVQEKIGIILKYQKTNPVALVRQRSITPSYRRLSTKFFFVCLGRS